MLRGLATALLLATLAAAPARADDPAPAKDNDEVHAAYDIYAAGLHVADVEAGFALGPWSYQVQLAYHTTGLLGVFYHGHQLNTVTGSWVDGVPAPHEFFGDGEWHGLHRITLIDYDQGRPLIRSLVPPNETERQPVPADLLANTIDTLSALAELMRNVTASGRCETSVHTYDGRRVIEITARTVGTETLAPTSRSSFSGPALRCDFAGRMLAGFLLDDHDKAHRLPLHGSAWLVQIVPATVAMPVRITFETRWFGDATMYLTSVAPRRSQQPPTN